MISGTFQVGETARTDTVITDDSATTFDTTGVFRIAGSSHKEDHTYLQPDIMEETSMKETQVFLQSIIITVQH